MGKKEDEFLSNYNHNIRLIIDSLSGIIFQTFPNIKEKLYMGWEGLGYTHPNYGYLFGIFPKNELVKLGFENGNKIKDKYNLFSEETKKIKYIIFKSEKDVQKNKDKIIEYLKDALNQKS